MGHVRTGRNHRPAPLGDWQQRNRGTPESRDAYRRRRDELAEAVAARLDGGREWDQLSEQIRAGMAELRACRTPAERAEVEARVKPLVIQRDGLAMWRPGIF